MPCSPPYYPSTGHESTWAHDNNASCMYYGVWAGRMRGIYTNSLANIWPCMQTSGFTDSVQKGLKGLADLNTWWHSLCLKQHRHSFPPFEPINFTVNPLVSTQPSTNPCMLHPAGPHPPGATAADPAPLCPAGSPLSSTSTSMSTDLFTSKFPLTSADSTPTSSPKNGVKEESCSPNVTHRVGPNMRVQLTPTGHARGANLVAARKTVVPSCLVPPTEATVHVPGAALTMDPGGLGILPIMGRSAVPQVERSEDNGHQQRHQAVFYQSWAAAQSLGLSDPKIMVTNNVTKHQA
ncbi:hypothetical protein K438DRAFT_1784813 [Mycena galopus ATCC 62051]|nr:hypothetical protein K438DRAFT_1784813 [Mycena galopus ATCC 62051]